MSDSTAPLAIGIDLGTTHCALSHVPPGDETSVPKPLTITQVIAPGETSGRPLLPSFLYLPAEGEFPPSGLDLPWQSENDRVTGEFARSKGASTPTRLVSSAKSWLSHAGVDRKAAILPWGAAEEVQKVSPLAASVAYLSHLRAAWDHAHPAAPLAEQNVVLTVPASFDAVARDLTCEAATLAGLGRSLRLLEEPQAALYDWVAQSKGAWRKQVEVGDRILVVDIGGGTTDFSLISVSEEAGQLQLERIAVGDHILLGGDNMDMALAYTVRARLEAEGKKLDDWQMLALVHACRLAKETLLSEAAPEDCPVIIPGRSSRLIGGSIRTQLTHKELDAVLLEGFFPQVPFDARPQAPRRVGLKTLGLPYASDAGITRHLAAFLAKGAMNSEEASAAPFPNKVLFNGGVTLSPIIQERLLGVLRAWATSQGAHAPETLSGTDAALAVSRGAAYYARALREGGLRIKSGTAQSHYIGIERSELAIPGIPPRIDAICVAPSGMEEGSEVSLEQNFGLVLGEPVSFRFFASSERSEDGVGTVVDPTELTELSPLETLLDGNDGEVVEVRLHARVTEVGTLEIAAVDLTSDRRWKLSFNIRLDPNG